MLSSRNGGFLGAELYNPGQVQASVCCYVGISQSTMGDGWSYAMQLGVGG